MKKFALLFVLLAASFAAGQSFNINFGGIQFSSGGSAPGSCSNGSFFYLIGTGWEQCVGSVYVSMGGGSGTVSANSGAAGAVANYAAAGGSTTVGPDTNLTDASNTLTYAGSGGITISSNTYSTAGLTIGTTNPLMITNDGSGRLTTPAVKLTSYLDLPSGTGIYDSAGSEGNAGAPLYSLGGTSGVLWAGQAAFSNTGATLSLGSVGGNAGTLTLLGTTSGSVSLTCSPAATCTTLSTPASFSAGAYKTATNCTAVGTSASPSLVACAAAASGAFSCATTASGATCVVSTTAVTTNSDIQITPTASAGTRLSVTCNTTADTPTAPRIAAIVNGTSFTINLGTVTANPMCFFYTVIN